MTGRAGYGPAAVPASPPRAPLGGADAATDVVDALARVLARATRALGEAGRPEHASRLAAQAWVVLRHRHPVGADRLNGALHYLGQLSAPIGAEPPLDPQPRTQEDPVSDPTANPTPAAGATELDVREAAPARRHELIFGTWAGLPAGSTFVLVNDHDPKPLYYQFAAEHAGEFSWEYLEDGPAVWRVRIGRA